MQLSRRTALLGAAAGLGTAAATLCRPAMASAEPDGIPTTMARLAVVESAMTIEPTEFPLTHLGVAWTGPAGHASRMAPQVRCAPPRVGCGGRGWPDVRPDGMAG